MIRERVLLDDGTLVVADVRCVDAPAGAGCDETVAATEVVIPLDGVFLRTLRRTGARGGTTTIGDPSRALVFRPDEAYRVAHPAGGCDRSLVITLPDGSDAGAAGLVDDRAVGASVQVAARRLARALAHGHADALAGAEFALSIVDAVGHGTASRERKEPGRADLDAAERTRLWIAARLGERATLPECGRLAGLSGWELARRFRRAMGTTIHRYRTALRVQAALERIERGERDLTALALDLGFADHSHLANVLRREAGRPPSAFRHPPTAAEIAALRTILQA